MVKVFIKNQVRLTGETISLKHSVTFAHFIWGILQKSQLSERRDLNEEHRFGTFLSEECSMKKFDRVFTKNLIGLQILAPENGHLEIRESEVEFKI